MTDKPMVQRWHEENLATFRSASNGSRNETLNIQALKSFGLALGDDNLSISQVESDYTSAATSLMMPSNEVKATLESALSAASPHHIFDIQQPQHEQVDKSDLLIAPVYTALDDYAKAHGVSTQVFVDAQWTEGEHGGRKCLLVPHEDDMVRARFLDGDDPKWKPIQTGVTPCWYGFSKAVSKARAAKHKTIVLTNGQPSVVVGQHYGVPALAQTDGEGKPLQKLLLRSLQDAIKEHGLKVIVAMDGDDTGRKATKSKLEKLKSNGIRAKSVYFGGHDGFDLADYCKLHGENSMKELIKLSKYGGESKALTVTSDDITNSTHGILVAPGENITPGEKLIFPFKRFHNLGGYVYFCEPGKMAMVLAPTGCGKTSLMETFSDFWNTKGYDTWWYGREWTPQGMRFRAIQRYSNVVTTDMITEHIVHASEIDRGIPAKYHYGKPIAKGTQAYNEYLQANELIDSWPGKLTVMDGHKTIEHVIEDMSTNIWKARREGRQVGCAFFDYAQILDTGSELINQTKYEKICGILEEWAQQMSIHVMVGAQPTKSRGLQVKTTNELLNEYDAMWIRPDPFKVVITLNIRHIDNGAGEREKTPNAIANVCKNSEGRTGLIKLRTKFRHLSWKDESWTI